MTSVLSNSPVGSSKLLISGENLRLLNRVTRSWAFSTPAGLDDRKSRGVLYSLYSSAAFLSVFP
jgi:hypothetical protein